MEDLVATFDVPFGDTTNAYPDVFNKMPTQPKESKPGHLSQEQIEKFFNEGYLVVENYFDVSTLDSCRKAIEERIDEFAKVMYKAGKIKDLYAEYDLFQRLTKINQDFPGSTMMLAKLGYLPNAFKNILASDHVIDAMEQFLGTADIQVNPVWNLRYKVPQNEATVVPWHQDVGYTDNDSHKVLQVTAWIPLLDVNEFNGCLQFIHKGHKTGQVVPHYGCWKSTPYVEILEEEMEKVLGISVESDTVTCKVPYGSVVFFSNIIPHRGLPNISKDIRWSLDLRWQRADQPVGFHGLSEGVRVRSAADPNFKVDSSGWMPIDGGLSLQAALDKLTENGTVFDPLVTGPWMQKWKIHNMNQHLLAGEKKLKQGKKISNYH